MSSKRADAKVTGTSGNSKVDNSIRPIRDETCRSSIVYAIVAGENDYTAATVGKEADSARNALPAASRVVAAA